MRRRRWRRRRKNRKRRRIRRRRRKEEEKAAASSPGTPPHSLQWKRRRENKGFVLTGERSEGQGRGKLWGPNGGLSCGGGITGARCEDVLGGRKWGKRLVSVIQYELTTDEDRQ